MSTGEFSVCTFFTDGSYGYELRFVDGETAVKKVKTITESMGVKLGIISRIIITDGGDHINLEWRKGEGIVFPKKDDLKL